MFFPTRLTVARNRAGLTKAGLSKLTGISSRTIYNLEAEHTEPAPETLAKLSGALGFPPEFFTAGELEILRLDALSFRALRTIRASQRATAAANATLAVELSTYLDTHVEVPDVDLPNLAGHDPEVAADYVRSEWGLGELPIPNMIHLLESHGIRVFSLAEDCREVDAFSFWIGERPFVVLNTQKSGERSRLDAAHELGHLLLHRGQSMEDDPIESEAQRFGGALLVPAAAAVSMEHGLMTIRRLVELKQEWGVSTAALAYRLHQVGMLSEWHYRVLFQQMGRLGYRSEEPEPMVRERSLALARSFELLREGGVSKADVAAAIHVPETVIDELTFGLAILPLATAAGTRRSTSAHSGQSLRLVED